MVVSFNFILFCVRRLDTFIIYKTFDYFMFNFSAGMIYQSETSARKTAAGMNVQPLTPMVLLGEMWNSKSSMVITFFSLYSKTCLKRPIKKKN